MIRFEIECGEVKGTVEAPTPQVAWKKLTSGKTFELGALARFREKPWNGKYSWKTPLRGSRERLRGNWHWVEPEWFEKS